MDAISTFFNNLMSYIPSLLGGILLILVAWIVAVIVRNLVNKGLHALKLDEKFVDWGFSTDTESAEGTVNAITQFLYYLVWILFLSPILQTFGLTSLADPVSNMVNTVLNYIPSIFAAIIIFIFGLFVSKFVYNLIFNFSVSINIDRWLANLSRKDEDVDKPSDNKVISKALATLGYIVVIIPIVTVALETLGISSISEPIIVLLNTVISAIPHILVAVILLTVGFFIAGVVGGLVADLLQGTGIDKFSKYLGGHAKIEISSLIGDITKIVIGLFFLVEALTALNLPILNQIGTAIIAYLPNVLFALIVLLITVVGGQMLGNFIAETMGSKWIANLVKFVLIILGVFMAFDELNIASGIVNTAFIFIIGAVSIAFAIAFGIGGRDFASRQLDKLDNKIDEETDKKETDNK